MRSVVLWGTRGVGSLWRATSSTRAGSFPLAARRRGFLALRFGCFFDAAICNGDYVVVRQQPNAENGEIVAALIEGEATVKTFQRKSGKVWLLPHNDAYDPIDGTDATILGKVTAVLRRV